jgi:hypothetical protein
MADQTTDWTSGNPFLGQNNPYLQANIDAASADMVKNYNLTQAPAFNAAMLKSGSFGNSAIDEMTRAGQDQLQKNLGNLSNSARMQDYNQQQGMYQFQQGLNENQRQFDQNFGRNVFNDAYSQNMNNLTTGIGLLGTLGGYNQQDLANSTAQQNTPLSYWQQFANSANSIGQGYGNSTTVQGTSSNPLVGAMGGAQLGKAVQQYGNQQGWWGSSNWQPNTSTGSSDWATGSGNYSQYTSPDYGQYF